MESFGWVLVALNFGYFVFFVNGMRNDVRNGILFGDAVVITPFLLLMIPVTILYYDINKIHILWLLPLIATILPAIIIRIPILNLLIAIPASLLSSLLMYGVEPKNSFIEM